MMDLKQHEEVILKWINSCTSSEQLSLLKDVIDVFVAGRFANQYDLVAGKANRESLKKELNMVVDNLRNAVYEQNLLIAGGKAPEFESRGLVQTKPPETN